MNDNQRQQANLAAARLLHYEPYVKREMSRFSDQIVERVFCYDEVFDIFNDPGDCQAVVKELGANHYCNIFCAQGEWLYWISPLGGNTNGFAKLFDQETFKTYEEAVGGAAIQVQEK